MRGSTAGASCWCTRSATAAEAAAGDIARMANLMPPLGLALARRLAGTTRASGPTSSTASPTPDADAADPRAPAPTTARLASASRCTTSCFLDGARIAAAAKELLPGMTHRLRRPARLGPARAGAGATSPRSISWSPARGRRRCASSWPTAGGARRRFPGVDLPRPDGRAVFTGHRTPAARDLDTLPVPGLRQARRLSRRPTSCRSSTTRTGAQHQLHLAAAAARTPAATATARSSAARFRYNSAEYLYEHLRHLRERFGIRHVNFYDDQFTFNRARVEEFCRLMLERPLGMTFNCAVRAEHVDPDLLRADEARRLLDDQPRDRDRRPGAARAAPAERRPRHAGRDDPHDQARPASAPRGC